MTWVILLATLTVVSVFFGMKQRKKFLFFVPFLSIFIFMLVKVIMVPLPFLDTVRFIFDLRG